MKRVLVIGVVLALLGASSAQAEPAATAEGDLAIAKEYWGREPTGCSSITFTTEVLGPEDEGEATQPVPGAEPVACRIAVREVWSTLPSTPTMVCYTTVHEWGHLLGEGHSSDPNSVMYAGVLHPDIPACLRWEETTEGQEAVARRHAWQEWREWRRVCKFSRGPFRSRCWRETKVKALRLRTEFPAGT